MVAYAYLALIAQTGDRAFRVEFILSPHDQAMTAICAKRPPADWVLTLEAVEIFEAGLACTRL
jgi:hypothetical protein